MTRLPPFFALRALEAAARHQSYSRAAQELSVTHGAVSQQIRRLEAELGWRAQVGWEDGLRDLAHWLVHREEAPRTGLRQVRA